MVNMIGAIVCMVKNIVFEHPQLVHRHPKGAALHFVIIQDGEQGFLFFCADRRQPPSEEKKDAEPGLVD